jgi:hypothetical protein
MVRNKEIAYFITIALQIYGIRGVQVSQDGF